MLVIIKKNENQVNNEILLHRILIKIALIKKQTKVEKCLQGCEEIVAARRSYPPSEARGNSWEELPHTRGQGWWLRPGTPCPRSGGCKGAGGPRGDISRSKSGGVAVRRYPSFNIRSSSCALLEQL